MEMNPVELGEQLARLVWESVTDFLERPEHYDESAAGRPAPLVMEEVLILFLWVHTRSCQQAFGTRADPESLRLTLDSLHRAVYEDMEAHGISRATLPLFEQRLSARYQSYYAAANGEPVTVVEVAAGHITGADDVSPAICAALAESTMTAAGPLRDFLEDVVLVEN